MASILRRERLRQARRLIDERSVVSVKELSEHFSVSEATIRRDLEELDSLGWVKRDHGGAFRADMHQPESPVLHRIAVQTSEKQRIGHLAAGLVRDGETIFIGSGTTTLAVARNLEGVVDLTVITNALNIANELLHRSGINLIVIGGQVRDTELSLIGPLTEQALKDLRADKVFLGIRSVNITDGLTNDHLPELTTDRAIIGISPELILVADHTKLGTVSTSRVAPITAVNTLVTDTGAPPEMVKEFENLGVRVLLA
jgi:DeoR/GlpR family transcriptional regulator of sugar metabolism